MRILRHVGPLPWSSSFAGTGVHGPVGDPSHAHDACFLSEKVETAQLLCYDAAIIANHHEGSLGGVRPDAYFCGGQGHIFTITASALCSGHRAMQSCST